MTATGTTFTPGRTRVVAWLAMAVPGVLMLTGPAAADIVIGLAGPMTGGNAAIGEQLRTGAEAAVDEVNAHGGVLGQKLALVVQDDGCDPTRAVDIANKLVADKVNFVLGHYCSATTLPASSTYADNGTVEITFSTNSSITEQGFDGLFRIAGRDDRQGQMLAAFMDKHDPGKRVALISDRSPYAAGLVRGLRAALRKTGRVSVVLDTGVDAGSKDFSPLIADLESSNPQVVVYVGYATEAGLILKQATAAGIKADYISTNTASSPALWDIAGADAEGLAFTFMPAADLLPTAKEAVARLQARGSKADGYTLYSYAAVQLFAEAMERAKQAQPEPVAAELQKGGLATVLGDVYFDEHGDNLLPSWRLYRWHEGAYGYYPGE